MIAWGGANHDPLEDGPIRMPLPSAETVSVTLLDEATGERLAVSNVPVAQLPDSFALATSLDVAGQRYDVARAEPPTKEEFAREKRLTLFLRKVESVDPQNILFSLPTLCGDALPESAPGKASAGGVCVLHEDDFRQCEMVATAHLPSITAELMAIQEIYASAAEEGVGFRKIHVRERIPRPLPGGLRWSDVTSRLGQHHPLGGIAFGDERHLVRGARAVTMRSGVAIWGAEVGGQLGFLCLENAGAASPETVASLKRLADDLSLILVDWCRCRVYCPGGGHVEGALGDPWDEVQ